MSKTKKLTVAGLFVALLLGGQLALSGISGIEVVTVLFFAFCVTFGAWEGLLVATAFSLLRCLLFGFYPSVVILYLVYYNAFALFFGLVGRKLYEKPSLLKHVLATVIACVFTTLFTLLDDVITPLIYGFSMSATKAYFYASFSAMIPQVICTATTVGFLAFPIVLLLKKLK